MSEASKKRPPISEETRRKMSEASKSRSAEISKANRNRIVRPETLRKMSEAQKARRRAQRELDAANATEQGGEV